MDMEQTQNAEGELEFQVCQKANKKLKYLNKGSTHMNATFNAIPSRIFNRLEEINSRTKKITEMKIDKKYQGHAKALTKSGLSPKIFPSLIVFGRK